MLKNPKTRSNVPAEYTTQRVKKQSEEERNAAAQEENAVKVDNNDGDVIESKTENAETVEQQEETEEAKAARLAEEDAKKGR